MNFTDDDLKRLKELINSGDCQAYVVSLLARMEAAEQALKSRTFSDSAMEQEADYEAWKKACGK